jgi:hypothetical protein
MFSCSSASLKMSWSAPSFSKGLSPAKIIYRKEAVNVFRLDLYYDSVVIGKRLYDRLTKSPVLPLVPIPAPVS